MKIEDKHITAGCYPCVFQQLLSIASLVELSEKDTKLFFEKSMLYFLETHGEGVVVQHVIRKATDMLIKMMGEPDNFDPYDAIKKYSNDVALEFTDLFYKMIRESNSPLEMALKIASAGNIIDFGAKRHGDIDIKKELASIDERGFGIYDYDEFYKAVSTAKSLLYICDNAGEIVMDKIFIEEIKNLFPSLNVVCAVREKPIINDAVLYDALYAGLDKVATVISSGSVYPGTIIDETSKEFREFFDSSDVIISKGQGNFETLLYDSSEKLFFILRIKCEAMAKLSNAPLGDLVLMQGKNYN